MYIYLIRGLQNTEREDKTEGINRKVTTGYFYLILLRNWWRSRQNYKKTWIAPLIYSNQSLWYTMASQLQNIYFSCIWNITNVSEFWELESYRVCPLTAIILLKINSKRHEEFGNIWKLSSILLQLIYQRINL